jgi:Leucine-rich repeat (LRR) protein
MNNVVATLPVLTTLIADHNNVKDFKAFNVEDGWKGLRVLNLSFNKIADLGSLAALAQLNELYLTENKIEKVESFGGHPKLKKLELRRNKVGNLQGLGNL